jgi:hypothetical protein
LKAAAKRLADCPFSCVVTGAFLDPRQSCRFDNRLRRDDREAHSRRSPNHSAFDSKHDYGLYSFTAIIYPRELNHLVRARKQRRTVGGYIFLHCQPALVTCARSSVIGPIVLEKRNGQRPCWQGIAVALNFLMRPIECTLRFTAPAPTTVAVPCRTSSSRLSNGSRQSRSCSPEQTNDLDATSFPSGVSMVGWPNFSIDGG